MEKLASSLSFDFGTSDYARRQKPSGILLFRLSGTVVLSQFWKWFWSCDGQPENSRITSALSAVATRERAREALFSALQR
jgi:hypothetical protein